MGLNNCSLNEVLKLILEPFPGDNGKLREFIENAKAVFELTVAEKSERLLKFIMANISGEAKSKLLARTTVDTWGGVKDVLEENYAVRRTLDFYACKIFNARQVRDEQVAGWGSKLDSMMLELKEVAVRVLEQ
ncbi:hypothetical protein PR048_013248 [Dryococelus australis]|uniref:Uncharacterized protein n=1 Tax=Dryococelus australis TaxID=614101 RepID=A0ABQ9HT57_9NEOP|nr:hypothetical protein PR048_013248 [Dryococelus australis]